MAERPISTVSDASVALARSIPLPMDDSDSLREPRPHFLDSRTPSSISQTPESALASSTTALPVSQPKIETSSNAEASSNVELGDDVVQKPSPEKSGKRRMLILVLVILVVLIVVILAVMLPVYFTVIKPKQASAESSGSGSSTSHGPTATGTAAPGHATSGGDGSTTTLGDGSSYTYSNKFGGFWVSDPNNPYNDGAQPNSWTPPLNTSWDYSKNRIFGVNLGGLFVLEPFISSSLFQKYPGSIDEWSLSIAMAADSASGGLDQIEHHYDTFITEKDIAEIAGAGLNWVRLPVPFWAIEKWPGEPFLEKKSWKYIVRLLQWCRKYGIRVNLDLHTIPGSSNAFDHGGKREALNFLNGAMGVANAQRTLYYIRVFTEFISQPEWRNVVPMFSIMNEPMMSRIGTDGLRSFYVEAHRMIREITGFGEGHGPYVVLHDSFEGLANFAGFMRGADRVGLAAHPYFAFTGETTAAPIDLGGPWPARACSQFGGMMNASRTAFGVTVAGEFSNAFVDCALYLKGIPDRHTYGGDCSVWEDSSTWTPEVKAGLRQFTLAQMDALGDFFFWTWRIGESERGIVESPLWSYKQGLERGWMPTDPRLASGTCESLGQGGPAWDGVFEPWMTGGPGAGAPTDAAQYPWPPVTIAGGGAAALLPTYTATGSVVTLPAPTFTDSKGSTIAAGNGWFNPADTAPAPTPIAGCTYPNAWDSENAAVPPLCGGGGVGLTPTTTASTDAGSLITDAPLVP